MEKSRLEVMECEEEIKVIKNSLKSLTGGAVGSADSSKNRLDVSVHKVKNAATEGGDGDNTDVDTALPTTFKVHLSSPIEERTISQLFDPLNPTAEESIAKFESVETSNALLTVEAYSKDDLCKLGVSAAHDLMPLCQDMDLWMKGGDKKVSTLEVAIVAEKGIDDVDEKQTEEGDEVKEAESESWEDAVEEIEKDEGGETETPKEEGASDDTPASDKAESPPQDESKTTSAALQLPLYTLTVQLEYTPSSDDKRDALYQALNEVSKRKVAAIESLRKNAGLVNRAKASEADSIKGGELTKSNPAVKSGFLNKSKTEKTTPFYKRWYDKTIGPKSMLWVVGPIAKNYIIFVGISLFIHYKGDLLALPPPV